ncbi:MAG: DEAD/DEAH box helicase, partial [Microbacterium sp.]
MPKNKKPAGGRAAKNFEPRYGEKKTSFQDRKHRPDAAPARGGAAKPGSKSPSHRGYRPAEEAPAKKRWTAQERAGRDEARGIRTHNQTDRPRYDRDSRPARDDRAPRRDDAYRSQERPGSNTRDDRGFAGRGRGGQENGKGRPSYGRDDRPRRDDAGRPARDDRAPRLDRVDRDNRRSFGDARPSFRRDERPARDDRAPRRDFSDRPARDDRAPRRDFSDRPARDDRPRYDSRPARDDRAPRRDFSDRPARDDRAPRRDRDDRPRRDSAPRPGRSDWNATPVRDKAHQDRVDVVHERLQADAVQAEDVAGVTFGDLGLGENIVGVLADQGAKSPFPIQAATIPAILEGRDVLARGRTGSGKTIAFGAPLVESILRSQAGKRREFGRAPKALILAPTRELALQIDGTIQPIARSVGLFTTQIYGGVPQGRQVGALKKGVDIIIGTPGRIEDLVNQGKLDLSEIRIVVLDEADHMCDLGFLEPVQRILRLTADGSQKLLFSATLDRAVAALVEEFLVEPAVHEVAGEDQDSSTIDHRILVIEHRDKAEILNSLVDRDGKTLVFA